MGSKYTDEFKKSVIELYNNVHNYYEVMRQTGISQETVRRWCDPKVNEKYAEYRKVHREFYRNYNITYHEENKDDIHTRKQKHYRENKTRINKSKTKRCQTDVQYRLRQIIRSRIRTALLRKRLKKTQKTHELLGCSIEACKTYLENMFTDGMSWANHGQKGWHIDHIIPCDSFNLENIEEQKKCFHYTNLQPLWWMDNLSKSNKIKPLLLDATSDKI